MTDSMLQTVSWRNGKVCLIDQTCLPERLRYVELGDWRDVVEAIRTMVVRGAPAIGCTAALGMALGARGIIADTHDTFVVRVESMAEAFRVARPTAVNLAWAVDRMVAVAHSAHGSSVDMKEAMLAEARQMLADDIEVNRALGQAGAKLMPDDGVVLTHCNAGALATVAYGTALGVIRAAVEVGKRIHVYADETRPRLQGMKLTAWELAQDGIPVTVIADGMAASLMRMGRIDCVVVGADRIAANGDTANKIGTYSAAVAARYHGIPFYVAAPLSTFDMTIRSGAEIPIEERESVEMTHIDGVRIAPEDVPVLNPAFDVTPAELVTAFITEVGLLMPPYKESLQNVALQAETVVSV